MSASTLAPATAPPALAAYLAEVQRWIDGEAGVDQEFEGAVDGGVADAGLALADLGEEIVDRDVVAGLEELLDDRFALGGGVEAAVLDIGAPALLQLAEVFRSEVRTLAHGFQLPCNVAGRQAIWSE